MESDGNKTGSRFANTPTPSPEDAAEQLKAQHNVQDQMKRRAPSRGSSWLSLWGAALMSSYIGVFLATFPALSTTDDTTDTFNFTQTGLLVFPVLLYSSLVVGAREHFSIRTRPTRRSTIAYALLVAAFIALLALRITGTQYPWWVNPLLPIVLFAVLAASHIARLLGRLREEGAATTPRPALRNSVRWNTVGIGVASGALVSSSTLPVPFSIATIIAMVWVVVSVLGAQTIWGLTRTGYEWGAAQWIAFGLTVSAMFGVSVLAPHVNFLTITSTIAIGVAIFLLMLAASVLPPGGKSRP